MPSVSGARVAMSGRGLRLLAPLLLLLLALLSLGGSLTTGGRGPAAPRRLPSLPTLWAPIDLARFLHHHKLEDAATAVMASVRLGAFDEIDGPAFLDGDGSALASRLSLPLATIAPLKTALRQAEESAYEQRTAAAAGRSTAARPLELGWGWAGAREASAGSAGLQQPELVADRIAGALWGIFIGDALAMPAHWYYDVDALHEDYGTITGYVAPQQHHATNYIMADHWRCVRE
jgi:hypothetical protein